MNENIIETQNLSFVYGKGTPFEKKAVDNINISIKQGEFIGLIGHTGSGKSTLIQMFNGIIKPTAGNVILSRQNIWNKPKEIRKIRFKAGMVFQYPEYQLFAETVYEDIAFGPKNMGYSEEQIKALVLSASKFVGLREDLLEKSPFDLSGGEKRRAAIAGVISMDPEILILDEPTAGLDPIGRDNLLMQIYNYHQKRKNTIILVSHNMEDIAKIADRVLVMHKGSAVMFEETQKVFSNGEKLEGLGLRLPSITKIMSTLNSKSNYGFSNGILTVEQAVEEIACHLQKSKKNMNL